MIEKPHIETARQRAERIWRNNYIQHHVQIEPQVIDIMNKAIAEEEKRMNSIRSRITRAITTILTGKNDKVISYYRIALEMKYRALLKEKLKRLRENGYE